MLWLSNERERVEKTVKMTIRLIIVLSSLDKEIWVEWRALWNYQREIRRLHKKISTGNLWRKRDLSRLIFLLFVLASDGTFFAVAHFALWEGPLNKGTIKLVMNHMIYTALLFIFSLKQFFVFENTFFFHHLLHIGKAYQM